MIQPMVDNLKLKRGARISAAIESAGFSQRQVAALVGVAPQSITKWIKTGNIQIENLVQLADITGVNLRYLIEGDHQGVREAPPKYSPSRVKLQGYVNQLTNKQLKKLVLCAEAIAECSDDELLTIQMGNTKISR